MTGSGEKPLPGRQSASPLVAAVFGRRSEVFRHVREKSTDTQGSPVGVATDRIIELNVWSPNTNINNSCTQDVLGVRKSTLRASIGSISAVLSCSVFPPREEPSFRGGARAHSPNSGW